MKIFHHLKKNLSLRLVNLVGLSVVFACLLLSAGYIRHELSYDRHNSNFDRIVRLSLQYNNEPIDGRILTLAGLGVLFISVVSVSMQSWRAATSNPVDGIAIT